MSEHAPAPRRLTGPSISVIESPAPACINLRGDAGDARFTRAVASVTDLALPREPGTSVTGLFASLLWLGPDEWLMVSESQAADEWIVRLRQALQGMRAAASSVGDGRIVYAVSGSRAREVLAKGCPLDLHPRAFAPGGCAQTVLAKLSVLIHQRTPEPLFDVYVARSYADHAWGWLAQAAGEYSQQ